MTLGPSTLKFRQVSTRDHGLADPVRPACGDVNSTAADASGSRDKVNLRFDLRGRPLNSVALPRDSLFSRRSS